MKLHPIYYVMQVESQVIGNERKKEIPSLFTIPSSYQSDMEGVVKTLLTNIYKT